MAQQITAVFDSQDDSSAAENRLRSEGFSTMRQRLGRSREFPRQGSSLANPLQSDLQDASSGIDQGQWAVTVEAPFGRARRVIGLLAEFAPVTIVETNSRLAPSGTFDASAASHRVHAAEGAQGIIRSRDHAFFISTLLGLPLLVNCPAPLSHLLGLPTLTGERE